MDGLLECADEAVHRGEGCGEGCGPTSATCATGPRATQTAAKLCAGHDQPSLDARIVGNAFALHGGVATP